MTFHYNNINQRWKVSFFKFFSCRILENNVSSVENKISRPPRENQAFFFLSQSRASVFSFIMHRRPQNSMPNSRLKRHKHLEGYESLGAIFAFLSPYTYDALPSFKGIVYCQTKKGYTLLFRIFLFS